MQNYEKNTKKKQIKPKTQVQKHFCQSKLCIYNTKKQRLLEKDYKLWLKTIDQSTILRNKYE